MTSHVWKYLRLDVIVPLRSPVGGWYLKVSPRMITCREFNDFIFDYIEGNLSKKQTVLFKRHMRVCRSCRNFLKTYLAAYKAKGQILPYDDIEVPDTVPQDLIDSILDVRRTKGT